MVDQCHIVHIDILPWCYITTRKKKTQFSRLSLNITVLQGVNLVLSSTRFQCNNTLQVCVSHSFNIYSMFLGFRILQNLYRNIEEIFSQFYMHDRCYKLKFPITQWCVIVTTQWCGHGNISLWDALLVGNYWFVCQIVGVLGTILLYLFRMSWEKDEARDEDSCPKKWDELSGYWLYDK